MNVKHIDQAARWFAGKGRTVAGVSPAGGAGGRAGGLSILEVRYSDGGSERYLDIPEGSRGAPCWRACARARTAGSSCGPRPR